MPEKKYECQFCGKEKTEDQMAHCEEDYVKCWSCWHREEEERENAMATLD